MKLELSWQTFENTQISDFLKIHPVGAKLFHVDGQTYRHIEDNSCFFKYCESTWKEWSFISTPAICLHGVDKDYFTFTWIRALFSKQFVLIISVGKFDLRILRKWKILTAVILMQ